MIVAYVSGHGFGHATRVGEVLRAAHARAPESGIAVVTAAPEMLFREALPATFAYRRLECDVGLAQRGALVIDEEETLARWRAFEAERPQRVESEAAWLQKVGASVVLADVPPLAFEAAAEAGVPAVGLANFSWDWIYRHLARRVPAFAKPARVAAAAYGKAHLLLELPFAGDLVAFPRREAIPMVARHQRRPREETRALLGLGPEPSWSRSVGSVCPASTHAYWKDCWITASCSRPTRPTFPPTS